MLDLARVAGFILLIGGLALTQTPWVSSDMRMFGYSLMPLGAALWVFSFMLRAIRSGRWIWPAYIVLSAAVLVNWLRLQGFPWDGYDRSGLFGKVALVGPPVLLAWWVLGNVLVRTHRQQWRKHRALHPPPPPPQKKAATPAAALYEAFRLARHIGKKKQDLRPAPTEPEITALEATLGLSFPFPPDFRRYLREISQLEIGSLAPAAITDPDAPNYLPRLFEQARAQGLPARLLPFCSADGDWYCFTASGAIEFWSAHVEAHDHWPSLADWIHQVWLREAAAPDLPRAPKLGTGVSALGADRIPWQVDP
ncbi:SMI1/KNR4 family protein [Solimonas sp. K1W22B-7]|uniref:SMI1/KNR4 family protein n=1 Tax=Solimonas sp. K1W22B-7 TaxID=2303331 RepID=UPI000E335A30|nr:SMI1/KNR4 family protein [Solimonas sp. K1W22B-7]AXQ30473.1 SMI1/KNR4 family protein [Solimonas sp. K1W22B-7]